MTWSSRSTVPATFTFLRLFRTLFWVSLLYGTISAEPDSASAKSEPGVKAVWKRLLTPFSSGTGPVNPSLLFAMCVPASTTSLFVCLSSGVGATRPLSKIQLRFFLTLRAPL